MHPTDDIEQPSTDDSAQIVIIFANPTSASCEFKIQNVNEIQLFGASEMLKQFAYEQMAAKAMQRQMEQQRAEALKPKIAVPGKH